ncbi:hypothetical protein ACO0QE_004504 [Hanseniaspora vineae]
MSKTHQAETSNKHTLPPQIRKSSRKRTKIDYIALNEGEGKRVLDEHFHKKAFVKEFENCLVSPKHEYIDVEQLQEYSDNISSLKPCKLPSELFKQSGMSVKIKTENGTIVENGDISFKQLCQVLGMDSMVPVMDVLTQENETWTIEQWYKYYMNHASNAASQRLKNVISLEIGSKELPSDEFYQGNNTSDDQKQTLSSLALNIHRPKIVSDNDLLDKVWKYNKDKQITKPQIQKYCLTGVEGCYTDFHVDFAGTNVYYNVINGEKWFLLYPMSEKNLEEYTKWCNSGLQNDIFLGSRLTEGKSFKIHSGELFLIPTGYIHAVYTPQNTYVIGGNYLTLDNLEKHIDVHELEVQLNVPRKFRFPEFDRIMVYIAEYILDNPHLGTQTLVLRLKKFLETNILASSPLKSIPKKRIKELVLQLGKLVKDDDDDDAEST